MIVVFIALTILSVFTISTFSHKSRSDAVALGQSVMIQEHEQVSSYMSRAYDAVQNAAINIEFMMRENAGLDKIEKYMKEQTLYFSEFIDENFTGIYGCINGKYMDGTDWVPEDDYVPTERDWYTKAIKGNGEPVIVDPYLDAKTNSIMLSISRMLYDGESVISVDIVMDKFQEIAETITLDGKGYGFICDTARLMIAHSDPMLKGADFADDEEMNRLFDRVFEIEDSGYFEFNRNNIDCTVFADNVIGNWYDVVVIDNSKLYQETLELTQNSIFAASVIYLIIALFSVTSYRRSYNYIKMVEESTKKVEHVTNASLRALARAIDAKDKYTQGHSLRVASYSRKIAEAMGKDIFEQNEIYKSALLHDIGKIRIPDDIINKPGKLTDEEFNYIKLHTVAGYGILRDITEDPMPALCAKLHHERYDGSGYPTGISGENIPEYARIISVADSYDAMASNRSYRNVLPQEVVRSEIEKGKGTQFDPDIADIMLEIIDKDTNYELKQQADAKKNILIIDKTAAGCAQLMSAFESEPQYNVLAADSEHEAQLLLEKEHIDLIMLDENTIEKPANEIQQFYREKYDIPVLFVINKKSQIRQSLTNLQVNDYVTKPISTEMFLEIIHSTLF